MIIIIRRRRGQLKHRKDKGALVLMLYLQQQYNLTKVEIKRVLGKDVQCQSGNKTTATERVTNRQRTYLDTVTDKEGGGVERGKCAVSLAWFALARVKTAPLGSDSRGSS